jgi:tRNA A37 threonylcarbamoyladenosine synthetase subunit TsaC/SUA5/YrdC
MGDRLPLIVDGGKTPRSVPSTIVDLTDSHGWKLIREGAISADEITEVLG